MYELGVLSPLGLGRLDLQIFYLFDCLCMQVDNVGKG
jgi:hypothetical protein